MAPEPNHSSVLVWCPLVPLDNLSKLAGYENQLEMINQAYDDWRSSMRGRSTEVDDVGVFLDRIRLLWISVGIACGAERALAEKVQAIIAEQLRRGALILVSKMLIETSDEAAVRQTLTNFFRQLRFGRDIFPLEEIQEAAVSFNQIEKTSVPLSHGRRQKPAKQDKTPDETVIIDALTESLAVLSQLYVQLLSPDPWGVE